MNYDQTPLIYELRSGTDGDEYIQIPFQEKIVDNKILLAEIPVKNTKVKITGYNEVVNYSQVSMLSTNEYTVNYEIGSVYFNPSENGKTISGSYFGKGVVLIPVERIFTKYNGEEVTELLSDVVDAAREGLEKIPEIQVVIDNAVTATNNANTATTATNTARTNISNEEAARVIKETSRVSAESARVTAETGRVNAESARVTKEGTRVTAETGRVNAETARTSAESTRQTDENTRKSNETNRGNAESSRVSSESSRVSAETARTTAETARVTADGNRTTAETSRVNAESNRVTAETARVSAETTRSGNETSRQQSETARGTAETSRVNAESARVTKEGARVTAETSRVNAESARVVADEGRTTGFNNKVIEVNNKISEANEKIGQVESIRDSYKFDIDEYSNTKTYKVNNQVHYNGSTYICIVESTGIVPTVAKYWRLFAAKGENGAGTVATITSTSGDIVVGGTASTPDLSVNATSTPTDNRIVKYDANGKTPLDAARLAEIEGKLPKANPTATGITTVEHIQTGYSFLKELGTVTFAAATANQKIDIEFPKEPLHGVIQIELSSYYGVANYTGNIVYRASLHASDVSGTIHSFFPRYVEATGHLAKYVALSPLRFDSVKQKFILSIALLRGDLAAALLGITMTGQSLTTSSRTSMMKATVSAVYTTNTDVYPLPLVSYNEQVAFNASQGTPSVTNSSTTVIPNWNSGLHNGWRRYNSLSELGITEGTETMDAIFNAMANYSVLSFTGVSSTSTIFPRTGGTAEITKIGSSIMLCEWVRGNTSAYEKYSGAYNAALTPKWSGWKLVALADGTLQTNLNAQLLNGMNSDSFYKTAVSLPSDIDLNNYTSEGTFYTLTNVIADTHLNLPYSGGSTSYNLQVIKIAGNERLQILTRISPVGTVYHRTKIGNTWSPWIKQVFYDVNGKLNADSVNNYSFDQDVRTIATPTFNGINFNKPRNWKDGNQLPSTYPTGESIFFKDDTISGFPATLGTVVTIKGHTPSSIGCTQYFYPYNVDAPIKYRHALYNSDVWLPWRSIATLESPAFTGVPTAPTAVAGTKTTQLATTAFVDAVRTELFQSVSDGKTVVAAAITDKGVLTAADATFQVMAGNISNIVQGSGNAQPSEVLAGKTYANASGAQVGTMLNRTTGSYDSGAISAPALANVTAKIPAAGYYGTAAELILTDADFIPSNIIQGVNIFGMSGSLAVPSNYTGQWAQVTSSFGSTQVNKVVYGGSGFVAVGGAYGGGGKIATSPNGITWTQRTHGFGSNAIFGVTYGKGLYVAVGQSGLLATSSDGINWVMRTSGFGTNTILSITYADGLYVAVGASGMIATSINGLSWTLVTSGFGTTDITDITFGKNGFVAVGYLGKIGTSFNGTTWTQVTSSFGSSAIEAVAYANGIHIAVGNSGKLATSSDGVTWTQRTSGFGSSNVMSITFGNGMFIAGGGAGKLVTSLNAINWTQVTSSFGTAYDDGINDAVFCDGMFVTCSLGGKMATLGSLLPT